MVSLSSSSMVGSILSTQGKGILEAISMQCTGGYGNITMAYGPLDSMYTTSTITHGITELKTLSLKNRRGIYRTMVKKGTKMIKRGRKRLLKKVWKPLKRGIKALKGWIGTGNMRLITTSGTSPMDQQSVRFAELVLKNRQAPTDFAMQTVKLERLEEGEEWQEQVFDLTVDEQHEYFVSGVLVHNCDAMRYAAISFKKPKTGLSMTFHK
jgi:hypothetical protein